MKAESWNEKSSTANWIVKQLSYLFRFASYNRCELSFVSSIIQWNRMLVICWRSVIYQDGAPMKWKLKTNLIFMYFLLVIDPFTWPPTRSKSWISWRQSFSSCDSPSPFHLHHTFRISVNTSLWFEANDLQYCQKIFVLLEWSIVVLSWLFMVKAIRGKYGSFWKRYHDT